MKLPAEVVVHIPALSDMSLRSCLEIASKQGVKLVENRIAELIAEEVLNRHKDRIEKLVAEKISDVEKKIISEVVAKIRS